MKILSLIGSLLDRLCIVVGAFIGSQIPQFMYQYSQRLGGHVGELQHLLHQMRQVASYSNKTLEQYIDKFLLSSDPDFFRQGEFLQGILVRWSELHQALMHLTQSSMWTRPYIFLKEIQSDIAHSTLASFQPGLNLSVEGFCYAGGGILIGWAFYQMVSKFMQLGWSRAASIFQQNI